MSIASVALSPVYEDYWNFPGQSWAQNGPWLKDSILIFLTVGGSVIPMRVLGSDSIASVKLRIQTYKGFFVKKQKLVFDGKELAWNNSRVRDYGVSDGNVLHLVLRLSDLQAIAVRTVCGKEFEFHVDRKRNVGYVKQQIAKRGKGYLNLKDLELICNGEELEDQRLIDDICRSNEAVIHLLVCKSAKVRAKPVEKDFEVSIIASELDEQGTNAANESEYQTESLVKEFQVVSIKPLEKDFALEPLIVNHKIALSLVIKQLVYDTYSGLEKGYQPVRSSEGSGGAYFMQDSSGQKYISVFKPIDEEPMAVNNPRGLPLTVNGEGLKKGTRVGEGAFREVAAYILDHPRVGQHSFYNDEKGFAGVPPTLMIKYGHKGFNYPEGYVYSSRTVKIGSLQMFMENYGSCEDMGPCVFPVDEVHKISVLDIRLANADRHAGNILVHRDAGSGEIKLIPIDHGYCLPENALGLRIYQYPKHFFIKRLILSIKLDYANKRLPPISILLAFDGGDVARPVLYTKLNKKDSPLYMTRTTLASGQFDTLRISGTVLLVLFESFSSKTARSTGSTGLRHTNQYSPETIAYIKSLDAEKDIELLKFYGWELSFECARVLHISTMLLKKSAERGLTPFTIGSIMCRETLKKESAIEQIVREAQEGMLPGSSEAAFLESVSSILDRHLDRLILSESMK